MRGDAKKVANDRVGTRISDKWLLDHLLGIGGCAAVFAATHRNGAKAAVKILHAHAYEDQTIRERFTREGYVANKVGHPGVVAVLDDDTTADGLPYLVMELLEGRSLDLHRQGEGLPIESVLRIGDQVLEVLERAHAAGIVHRDLKPANLFVTTTGQVKVLDFGIARLLQTAAAAENGGATPTQTGVVLGTAAFMPPEQARGRWEEVDGRADLWALAATMLALILGKRPRIAGTSAEDFLLAMTEPMPPSKTLVPGLSAPIARVLDCALAFKRDDRWPDAGAMREALRVASKLPDIDDRSSVKTLVNVPTPRRKHKLSGTEVMATAPKLPKPPKQDMTTTLPLTPEMSRVVANAVAPSATVSTPPTGPTEVPVIAQKAPATAKNDTTTLKIVVAVVTFIALALASFTLVRLARHQ